MQAELKTLPLRVTLLTGALTALFCIPSISVAQIPTKRPTQASSKTFTQLAERAQKASDENRLDEAVRLYARALAIRPKWAEGWWARGTLEYDLDHYANAARSFEKLIALQPKNGTAHVMLGLCEFELGREDLALRHIQKGKNIGINKDDALARVVLYHEGVLLQRKGSFQAAQDTLEELCLRGGQSAETFQVLGMTLLRQKSKSPPKDSADSDIVTRIGQAECLAGQKKYEDAKRGFEDVVSQNPAYPNVHYAYGLFLLETLDVASAVDQLEQEVKNNPDHVVARLRIAAAQYKRDSAAGIAHAEAAVKLSPQLGFAHYLLGLLLLDTDNYQKAIPELEVAQKSFSREAKLYFALGSAYSRAGRKQDAARARATFERLTKEAGSPAAASDELGLRKDMQDRVEQEPSAPQ